MEQVQAETAYDGEFISEAVGEDGLLEIPAGTLDVDGESPLQCAERECLLRRGQGRKSQRKSKSMPAIV
jgi:hypothetical protein